MNRLLVSVLFLAACGTSIPVGQNASSAGNGSTSTPVAGASCQQDLDCVTGEACDSSANKCEKVCGQDQDCVSGDWCQSGYCKTKPSGATSGSSSGSGSTHCTTKTDCATGQVCLQGACLASGAGGACHTESDCTTSSASCVNDACSCTNGTCVVKTGAACTAQTAYSVCATNQFCDNGTCSSAKTCTQQSDCTAAGLICNGGYCKTPQPCSNGTCPNSFKCTNNFCAPDDTGATCSQDSDCSSGYFCQLTGGGLSGGLTAGTIGGLGGGSGGSTGGTSGGTCQAGCKSNADCPISGETCDTLKTHQCTTGNGGTGGGSGTGASCLVDTDCDPDCTSGASVCDIGLFDSTGVCRDRCVSLSGMVILACPLSTEICTSVSNPAQANFPAGYCGSSPFGGFSYCQ